MLEVSCGTGWLLAQYAGRFQTYAVDLNEPLVRITAKNVAAAGSRADIQIANVCALPYPDGFFDSLVNTMAFSGYPDSKVALAEIKRVLRPGGKLIMVDINYPKDGRWFGWQATRMWAALGDIIRDMPALLAESGFDFSDEEIGGFGSVHLYVAARS